VVKSKQISRLGRINAFWQHQLPNTMAENCNPPLNEHVFLKEESKILRVDMLLFLFLTPISFLTRNLKIKPRRKSEKEGILAQK
jgi:hypothetical protein